MRPPRARRDRPSRWLGPWFWIVALAAIVGLAARAQGEEGGDLAQAATRKVRILTDRDMGQTARDSLAREEEDEGDERFPRDRGDVNIRIQRNRASDANDRVAFGHDIRVEVDDVVTGDVVCIFGSARVDGTVRGNVVSIGGEVEIGPAGLVRGEAIAIGGGSVRVGAGGVVEGEAVAVGGRVRTDEEALVGERVEISFVPSFGPGFGASGLLWLLFLAHLLFAGLAGWLLTSLGRRRAGAAIATLRVRGWESLLAGIGGAILYHIVILPLLLLLSIVMIAVVIGIPLVPVLALLFFLLPVPGYLVTAELLGLTIRGGPAMAPAATEPAGAMPEQGRDTSGLVRAFLLGHLVLSIPGLLSLFLALLSGGPGFVSKAFLLLSVTVINLAIALGWGAILISRFGRRWPAAG